MKLTSSLSAVALIAAALIGGVEATNATVPTDRSLTAQAAGYGFVVSQIRNGNKWCLSAAHGARNNANLRLRRCDFVGVPHNQMWRFDDDGKLHTLLDDSKCMVANHGNTVRNGVRMRINDCNLDTNFNEFNLQAGTTDHLALATRPNFCITNRGPHPHPFDTIHAKPCKNRKDYQWTFHVPCSSFLAANQNADLFAVNPGDASSQFIGALPAHSTEIEFDNINGLLYSDDSNGSPFIRNVDYDGTEIGSAEHPCCALNGMEFIGQDLYATNIDGPGEPSKFVKVDPATGAFDFIGRTGLGPITGLAYDSINGILWGITNGERNGILTGSQLVTIDVGTGIATPIVTVTSQNTGFLLSKIGSIEFGPDGNLYGGMSRGAPLWPGHIVRIDTVTGVATDIGDTSFGSITGLTCYAPN